MRDYGNKLTEQIQIRVSPEMAKLLRGMPGGYNNYIRELVLNDLKKELAELGQLSDAMAIAVKVARNEAHQ